MSDAATHRMGISNMQERMAAFGGSVEIDSEIGGGTVVTALWAG
jgi:signal transduction histidine kinase